LESQQYTETMTEKKQRGGRREGAGRRLQSKRATQPRTKTGYTIQPEHYCLLQAMSSVEKNACLDAGLNISIPAFKQSAGAPAGTRECLLVYHALGNAIEAIERARDYHPESSYEDGGEHWTDEQRALHTLLNRMWDEIHRDALFTEPQIEE
jgi:hypothetical protein